jgi:hypothetical protein
MDLVGRFNVGRVIVLNYPPTGGGGLPPSRELPLMDFRESRLVRNVESAVRDRGRGMGLGLGLSFSWSQCLTLFIFSA